jgi:hypothetical protein
MNKAYCTVPTGEAHMKESPVDRKFSGHHNFLRSFMSILGFIAIYDAAE